MLSLVQRNVDDVAHHVYVLPKPGGEVECLMLPNLLERNPLNLTDHGIITFRPSSLPEWFSLLRQRFTLVHPLLMSQGALIQLIPMQPPLRHEPIHQRFEAVVMA